MNLIHEKLLLKKQQQLRELRAIQEEIKEGKLVPPSTTSYSSNRPSASNHQQPPPNTKLHTTPLTVMPPKMMQNVGGGMGTNWPPVKMHCLQPPPPSSPYYPPSHPLKRLPKKTADNSEIVLAPRCLPYNHYSHWTPPMPANHR